MHADVERFSFDPSKHFLRVLQQQGRVSLAADGNEQVAILLEYVRALAADLIGPFGTPADADNTKPGEGFKIGVTNGVATIGVGHFWVDGLLAENVTPDLEYTHQLDLPEAPKLPEGRVVVYLDVWERHVTSAQDESIREVALGGPDTCSRSKLVWQVRAASVPGTASVLPTATEALRQWITTWHAAIDPPDRGMLAVTVPLGSAPSDPCQVPAGAGYFGNENQLYRVEVYRGTTQQVNGNPPSPTFVWSRDNGSVTYPLESIDGTVAVLRDPPIDCRKQLAVGTLVEVVDDRSSLLGRPGPLGRVVEVDDDGDDMVVRLSAGPTGSIPAEWHPLLRRWDHPDVAGGDGLPLRADDGALTIAEGTDAWLTLEDGIQIRFAPAAPGTSHIYRTGDYWTFPARAATADVAWPRDTAGEPIPQRPHGIDHHQAPLAVTTVDGNGKLMGAQVDCRIGISRLATLLP
jgi:hypothetical protein